MGKEMKVNDLVYVLKKKHGQWRLWGPYRIQSIQLSATLLYLEGYGIILSNLVYETYEAAKHELDQRNEALAKEGRRK